MDLYSWYSPRKTRDQILFFSINSIIGNPICIDFTFNKASFDKAFGNFVRVLDYIDLAKDMSYKILVERVGFAFFVEIEYEILCAYCSYSNFIGHNLINCKRKIGNQ